MDIQRLLVRTSNAAKRAREQGCEDTADAFDEIVEKLLEYMNAHVQSPGEKRPNSRSSVMHIH
ncbi:MULTISPECIES: hypothetical protein [unclassified Roseovarius]|uniref:hypothetical protein n=1 Tax=unclassified Roseovarius TaxID=2614913 RepID=UPI00273D3EC5|nr:MULTISPECIES: hypothetical protein [unclassified Roseovarius]